MPILVRPLADEYIAITREITLQLTKFLIMKLNLVPETVIQFKGESTQLLSFNSEKRKFRRLRTEDSAQFNQFDRLVVEVKENHAEGVIGRLNHLQKEIPPIWTDPNHGIEMTVQYLGAQLEINYTYYSSTAERTHRLRSTLAELIGQQAVTYLQDIDYAIIPDHEHIELLSEIHRLQENQAGYGVEFEEWLLNNSAFQSLRTLSNIRGKQTQYAFKEKQIKIPTILDLTQIPEKSKQDKGTGHEISLELKLEYEKPRSISLRYPLVVHNQMLPAKFNPGLHVSSPSIKRNVVYHHLQGKLEKMLNLFGYRGYGDFTYKEGVIVPLGDDWCRTHLFRDYRPIFTGMAPVPQADDRGYYKVGNLTAYESYLKFTPAAISYMKKWPWLLKYPYQMVFLVEVFKNNDRLHENYIEIDKELNIWVKDHPLTLRDRLHVSITTPRRLNAFDDEFFKRIADCADFAEEMLARCCRDYMADYSKRLALLTNKPEWKLVFQTWGDDHKRSKEMLEDILTANRLYSEKGAWLEWSSMLLLQKPVTRMREEYRKMYARFLNNHPKWLEASLLARLEHVLTYRYEYGLEWQTDNNQPTLEKWYGKMSWFSLRQMLVEKMIDPINTSLYYQIPSMKTQLYAFIGAKRHE